MLRIVEKGALAAKQDKGATFCAGLAAKLAERDAFGLTPLQRAYECLVLTPTARGGGKMPQTRASSLCVLRLLATARLLLAATGHLPALDAATRHAPRASGVDEDGHQLSLTLTLTRTLTLTLTLTPNPNPEPEPDPDPDPEPEPEP